MKRFFIILICSGLLLSGFGITNIYIESENNFVSAIPNYNSEARNSTLYVGPGQTYTKIQDAIDNANSGDIIRVYAGIFGECLSIKKTLSIIGNGSATTIINGSSFGEAFFINADWCNISGFTIIDGVTLTTSNHNLIDDCLLELDGIYLDNSDNNKIKDSICNSNEDDGHGIYLFESDNNVIESCIYNSNYMSGIYLKNSNNNIIINSTCNSNGYDGISLYESHYNIIKKSIFNKNEKRGIELVYSNSNTIVKCNSNLNKENGMAIDGSNNYIIENTCNSNNMYGIDLGSISNDNTIAYNNCSENDIGIYNWGSDINLIKYNNLFSNINYGIEIHTALAENNFLHHNNFMNNKGSSQALDHGTNNIWNTDAEGNYWSNWTTPDNDENGIVDIPKNIPGTGNSIDYYPLISPVNITNLKPVSNAGPDQKSIINQIIQFNGSGSYDIYKDFLMFKWDFGDGTSTGWQTDCNSSHSYHSIGNYTVKLTVSDYSLTDFDTCIIFIINQAPIANAGPDRNVTVDQTIYFNGTGSYDPDGDPLEYFWNFGDGTTTGWTNLSLTFHTYTQAGNYTVTLSVRDTIHPPFLVDNDTCFVNVSKIVNINHPPTADAGPDQNATINQTVYFDGSGSKDPDGNQMQYNWDFGDGTSSGWLNSNSTSHSYSSPGNYTVKLTVSDGEFTDEDTCTVIVKKGWTSDNRPPVADAGPDHYIQPNSTVIFNGSGSYDPDGDPLLFMWYFPNMPSAFWSESSNYIKSYSEIGTYVVTLQVTDGEFTVHDNCTVYVTKIYDTDGDGLPDDWELDHGLDPNNADDALLDNDGDSLTNLEEFKHGTNPHHKDTDGDSLPDGWEVQYGLDPLDKSDAEQDSDNDTLPNSKEYELGTDPFDSDTDDDGYNDGIDDDPLTPFASGDVEDDEGSTIDTNLLILIALIIIIILIIVTAVILKSKMQRGAQPETPVDDRQELRDNGSVSEFQPETEFDLATDEAISDLKNEALSPDKPSELGPSHEEMLTGFEDKLRKGELSQSTYEAIQASLSEPKP